MSVKISSSDRIKELRALLGLNQTEMAKPFNLSVKGWSSIETGRSKLTEDNLRIFIEHFGVNPLWILSGEGPMLLLADPESQKAEEPAIPFRKPGTEIITVTVDSAGNENIVLVGNKARGGYPNHYMEPEFLSDLPAFSLPGTRFKNGTFRAFEVAGDSMQPTCYPGDIVIAQKLYNWATEIREGYVHIIVTKDDILVKRVLNRLVESGNLVLKSDNFAYPVQLMEGEDVLEVWIAKAKLSPQFINSRYDGAREQFQTQANLAELASELDEFKRAVAERLGVTPRELSPKKNKK